MASMNETARMLESALQANLKLQADLMSQIDSVCQQKVQNRHAAAKAIVQLGCIWAEEYRQNSEPYKSMPYEFYRKFSKRLRDEYEAENTSESFKPLLNESELDGMRKKFRKIHRKKVLKKAHQNDEISSNLGDDNVDEGKNTTEILEKEQDDEVTMNQTKNAKTDSKADEVQTDTHLNPKRLRFNWKLPKKLMLAWQYNPDRRWHRRFFVDPAASIPRPNDDTLKRRQMEKGIPFSHLVSPWSSTEIKKLREFAADQMKSNTSKCQLTHDTGNVNDEQNEHTHLCTITSMKNNDDENKIVEFSESMIDFKKLSSLSGVRTPQECRDKYLYEESPLINKSTFTRDESIQIMKVVQNNDDNPSWDLVAKSLGTSRTAFQCFHHFMTKLDTSQVQIPWTPDEDELLLRYIAACGPQFVLSLRTAGDLGSRLLPGRPAKQILNRAHHTHANPKFIYDKWSEDEERMLALSIRAYRNSPSPPLSGSRHFPTRCSKMVVEKWTRSLSPKFSTHPFTAKEDKALATAVKNAGYSFGWKDIAQYFPNRRPVALKNRWMDLATSEELLMMHDMTMKKKLTRRGIVGEDSILHPNDLVVRQEKIT